MKDLSRSLLRSTTVLVAGLAVVALAACSSGDSEEAQEVPDGADAAMVALCSEMVDQGLTPEEADALAMENGYVTRVGSVDGEPMAGTTDYRTDRFTFEVESGAVVACTYG